MKTPWISTCRARLLPLVPAVLIAVSGIGCGLFKPDKAKEVVDPPFTYPDFSTPEHTLWNLKYAWEKRDSARTDEIYDDAYIGTSVDLIDNTGTLTYSKAQEVAVVGSMFRSPDINRVSFEMKPESTWIKVTYQNDPQGWVALQLNSGVNIQVDDAIHGTQIANSSVFEFKFVPIPDSSSPTDTTWRIVRWTETRQAQ